MSTPITWGAPVKSLRADIPLLSVQNTDRKVAVRAGTPRGANGTRQRPNFPEPFSRDNNEKALREISQLKDTFQRAALTTGKKEGRVPVSALTLASIAFNEKQHAGFDDGLQDEWLKSQLRSGLVNDDTVRQLTGKNRAEMSFGPMQIQLRKVHELLKAGLLKVPPEFQPAGGMVQGAAYSKLPSEEQAKMAGALVIGRNSSVFVAAALLERDLTRFVKNGGDERVRDSSKPGASVVASMAYTNGIPAVGTARTKRLTEDTDIPWRAYDVRLNLGVVKAALGGRVLPFAGYHP
jgi:hypothetical protein